MSKQSDSIRALARTADEKILLSQIAQKAEICHMQNYMTYTKFLDMHEADLARRLIRGTSWMEQIPQSGALSKKVIA